MQDAGNFNLPCNLGLVIRTRYNCSQELHYDFHKQWASGICVRNLQIKKLKLTERMVIKETISYSLNERLHLSIR